MIYFIIPEYGMREYTLKCVASIQTEIPHEIIIGNDGHKPSGDIQGVKIIDWTGNLNYVGNIKRTVEWACVPHDATLFILNSDLEFLPGAIELMDAYCQAHRAIVGPAIIVPDGIDLTHRQFQHADTYQGRSLETVYTLTMLGGCCLAMRMSVWAELAGFDSQFQLYFSDDDICIRARKAGIEVVYLPEAGIKHQFCATIKAKIPKTFWEIMKKDRLKFEAKYPGIKWSVSGEYPHENSNRMSP